MENKTGAQKFDICFCVIFDMFDKLIFDFWRKDWRPGYALNFLKDSQS